MIYGVALLALCSLAGLALGDALGVLIGVKANVGGIGFAMLLLIGITGWLSRRDGFKPASAHGIAFWSSLYLPIVVAMAAQQNVVGAIRSGPVALLAGLLGVALSFALVPLVCRIGRPPPDARPPAREGGEPRA